MNKILYIIITGMCFSIFSCEQRRNNEANFATANSISINTNHIEKKSIETKPDYIVFGRFCGECGGECATMYKFDVLNNKLFADHTDSYWKQRSGEPMKFETVVTDSKTLAYVKELSENLPDFILNASSSAQRFGCPDCTDGCGIFFEIQKDNTVKKCYIDYQTRQLQGDVKIFAEKLKALIGKME